MKDLFVACASLILVSFILPPSPKPFLKSKSIYDFKVEGLSGGTIDFSQFKGKKILIVNTVSHCKFTPQYEYLEKLYQKYKNKLVIVGFPTNNFDPEFSTSDSIKAFCVKNYGVTFPMSAKVSVKGGDIAPIFKWLTNKAENGVMDAEITWNFTKFLLDENGVLIAKFDSNVGPLSDDIVKYLR